MASLEETIKENFRYGITDMLILKLLTEEDKYVYQITRDLEEKSNGVFKVSKVSLYIPLNRMAQRHFVEEYKMPIKGGRYRKYYRITETGRNYLNFMEKEYRALHKSTLQIMRGGTETPPRGTAN